MSKFRSCAVIVCHKRYPEKPFQEPVHGKTKLNIRAFKHSLPQPDVNYYFTPKPAEDGIWGLSLKEFGDEDSIGVNSHSGERPTLCIGMSFYNEDPQELRRTLVKPSAYATLKVN